MSRYHLYIIKNYVEHIFILPFIVIGRLFPLAFTNKKFDICFLFPFYHTGGAEKVHLQIVAAANHKSCLVIFTRKSIDDNYIKEFQQLGITYIDISKYTDNKWQYWRNLFYRGRICATLKKYQLHTVFNGQCNFAYKISPWLNKSISQIELIHSFNSFSWIRIPYIQYYRNTVMISQLRIAEHIEQYKKLGIPSKYATHIIHINNAIDINPVESKRTLPFKVLYVGRNSPEKRIHLFLQIAKRCFAEQLNIEFHFAGISKHEIKDATYNCIFHGNISDVNKMNLLYGTSHVLMLLSNTEGFPMVIIEAMAQGCAIIATPVGDIPRHINTQKSGLLLSQIYDEDKIIDEVMHYLLKIHLDEHQQHHITKYNKAYALDHFHLKAFNFAYQKILGIETT